MMQPQLSLLMTETPQSQFVWISKDKTRRVSAKRTLRVDAFNAWVGRALGRDFLIAKIGSRGIIAHGIIETLGGTSGMDDVLTVAEIESRFASEWILIEDPQTNQSLEAQRGKVRGKYETLYYRS